MATAALRYASWLPDAIRQAASADAVVIGRNAALAGPPLLEAVASLMGKHIIYDLDDAVYLPPDGRSNWLKRLLRCDWRVGFISSRALIVGVGNNELERFVSNYQKETRYWPTTIDLEAYSLRGKTDSNKLPIVGWTGSSSTANYIEPLLPLLRELQQEIPFELHIMGADFDLNGKGIKGVCIPWSPEAEIPAIQRMDIGLMPLIDSQWARGKCSLKALQYQAVGTPAVVSDVGMNREAVLDGKTGFVVPPGEDWKVPLRRLLLDRNLRRSMGLKGREHVAKHFSGEVVAARVAEDIKAAVGHQLGK